MRPPRGTDPPPPGFRRVEKGRTLALLREPEAGRLIEAGLLDPEPLLRERGSAREGRGPVALIDAAPGARLVLKKYRRGGLAGRVLPDLFSGTGRMLADLRASERARARGVATPAVQALVFERRAGPLFAAWLASEEVRAAVPLADALSAAAALSRAPSSAEPNGSPARALPNHAPSSAAPNGSPARALPSRVPSSAAPNGSRDDASTQDRGRGRAPAPAAHVLLAARAIRAVRALHDAGIVHRDLNLGNLLVVDGSIVILDLDGAACRESASSAERFSNLSRLDRSYLKQFGDRGPLTHEDRLALMRRYCEGDDAMRRAFESRLAAHKRSVRLHRLLW